MSLQSFTFLQCPLSFSLGRWLLQPLLTPLFLPSLPGLQTSSSVNSLNLPSSFPPGLCGYGCHSRPLVPPPSSYLLHTCQVQCQSSSEVPPAPSIYMRSSCYHFPEHLVSPLIALFVAGSHCTSQGLLCTHSIPGADGKLWGRQNPCPRDMYLLEGETGST